MMAASRQEDGQRERPSWGRELPLTDLLLNGSYRSSGSKSGRAVYGPYTAACGPLPLWAAVALTNFKET